MLHKSLTARGDWWFMLTLMCVLQALTISISLLALSFPAGNQGMRAEPPGQDSALVSPTEAAIRPHTRPVEWISIRVPGQGTLKAAVVRPIGEGRFPAVILLHGTHGFAQEYVELAQDLAEGGVVAVALCWFSGRSGVGSRFVHPINCPDAPPLVSAASAEAKERVDAGVRATRVLPGVRSDCIALFGHSRGGGAALSYALTADAVQAVVLDSAGYPSEIAARAPQLKARVLILHGVRDNPADGGNALTDVQMARNFEAALRRAGKPIEATYYETGGHNSIFTDAAQRRAEIKRTLDFLHRCLATVVRANTQRAQAFVKRTERRVQYVTSAASCSKGWHSLVAP